MSDLPSSSHIVPLSPSHTDESGYHSTRGSSSCPPSCRFFPPTSDADFELDSADQDDEVFNQQAEQDFDDITMVAVEEDGHTQQEEEMNHSGRYLRVFSRAQAVYKSSLQLNCPRALSFPFDLCAGSIAPMRRHLMRRSSLGFFWEDLRVRDSDKKCLNDQDEEVLDGDGIDEGVPEAGSPPKKFLNFAALEDNEFFSDDEPNSDGSHSPEVDPDEDVKLDLPDIIISGMRRTRTRTMSESEVLRVKNLEYRIACRLAQIGDEFDLQMFQDMGSNMDVTDGRSGILGWIGSGSSAAIARFWHCITRQGGATPFGLSRGRSHSTAD